jgi:hypothetical protein
MSPERLPVDPQPDIRNTLGRRRGGGGDRHASGYKERCGGAWEILRMVVQGGKRTPQTKISALQQNCPKDFPVLSLAVCLSEAR